MLAYWQEIVSLSIVAGVAALFLKRFIDKQRKSDAICATGCGCAAGKMKTVKTGI